MYPGSTNFYPRSPCGERRKLNKLAGLELVFLSTLSLRRATMTCKCLKACQKFLSTLSLRRATSYWCWGFPLPCHFYPRSPCGERLAHFDNDIVAPRIFLSTLSLRRATRVSETLVPRQYQFLSTLSLRRATGVMPVSLQVIPLISIHALLAESDPYFRRCIRGNKPFLSTLSLRRATLISFFCVVSLNYFYPRSPCGERLHKRCQLNGNDRFLSTLSLRRATLYPLETLVILTFLSTLSLRRATLNPPKPRRFHYHFYPRSPCGERPVSPKL